MFSTSRFLLAAIAASLLFLAPVVSGGEDANASRELLFQAADQYAEQLMEEPPEELTKGEIAMAFGWIYLNDMLGGDPGDRAVKYLETALAEGVPEAGVVLGAMYLNADVFPGAAADPAKALSYYEKAADAGSVDAHRMLGVLLSDGAEGIPADPEKGHRHLVEAAKRGSDIAIQRVEPLLGKDGLPATLEELVDPELVAQAKERSSHIPTATARVFDLLDKRLAELALGFGEDGPELPDSEFSRMTPEEQAQYWARMDRAVDEATQALLDSRSDPQSAGEAALVIGILHRIGFLHGSDPDKARKFMEYALERDVAEAKITLGEMYLNLTGEENNPVERNTEKGLDYLTAAAEGDHVDAQRLLGFVYANGIDGVEEDKEKAEKYFLAAARHGDQVALDYLEPVFARAKQWEEEHPGEKSPVPTSPEAVVVPELEEANRQRSEKLAELAAEVNDELNRRIGEAMSDGDEETTEATAE